MLSTCVRCGKQENVPYYTSWWAGHCDSCAKIVLADEPSEGLGSLGDSHNGAGCYDSDADFS